MKAKTKEIKAWIILEADNKPAIIIGGKYIVYRTKKEALKEWADDCIEKVKITL